MRVLQQKAIHAPVIRVNMAVRAFPAATVTRASVPQNGLEALVLHVSHSIQRFHSNHFPF